MRAGSGLPPPHPSVGAGGVRVVLRAQARPYGELGMTTFARSIPASPPQPIAARQPYSVFSPTVHQWLVVFVLG